jgi:F-type H+-transporting ATPase subunit gamma
VHLLVVMTAERGLCGGFNSSIVRLARQRIDSLKAAGKTVKILTVGKKGREQLKRDHSEPVRGPRGPERGEAHRLCQCRRYRDGPAGPLRRGRIRRRHDLLQPLPVGDQPDPDRDTGDPGAFEAAEEDDGAATLYDYEPSEEGVLADLLPRGVATQIFTALLENAASEQGARMSAMDNATRNAGEMIDRLTIEFNRSRQAVITNELIEIISGAEAL